eukprot:scaffold7143_cov71-Cyclotella_meneghiniana.AAC.3
MNKQTVELVKKSSLDVAVPDEIIAVDTSQAKRSILVASANQVSLLNSRGAVVFRTPFPEKICCASLHPSGNHLIVGSQEKFFLANVLVDQIRVFHEVKTRCTDVKFNLTGSVFSVIVGQSIEIYDFISGDQINVIRCNTFFHGLRWGIDCQMYATSKDNELLCCWDAISGKSTISDEGLVLACMRNRDTNRSFLKIISLDGQEQFDQPINETIQLMTVSSGLLLTNNSMYSIKDHREINQSIITAFETVEMDQSKHVEDCSDVLITALHIEHQAATLQDVRSRLADLEILIDLEYKSETDQIALNMKSQAESNSRELNTENYNLDLLRQRKEDTEEQCRKLLEQAIATSVREVKELQQKNKQDLMRQVKIYYDSEQVWEKQKLEMSESKRQLLDKQACELEAFRSEAKGKLTKQQDVWNQLCDQKNNLERESKERICQLVEEVENHVITTKVKINQDADEQRETAQQLLLDNGIVTRRIQSTQQSIEHAKENVALMLNKVATTKAKLNQKEAEFNKLKEQLRVKCSEVVGKESATARLASINAHLLKARAIEEDKTLETMQCADETREKLKTIQDKIEEKLLVTRAKRIQSTLEEISNRTKSIAFVESRKKVAQSQSLKLSSRMENLHAHLEELINNIQDHEQLKSLLTELSQTRSVTACQPEQTMMSQGDIQRSNEMTMKLLELSTEYKSLKQEEIEIAKKQQIERQRQVEMNSKLLEKVSSRKTTRKMSGVSNEIMLKTNKKRIQALRG